MKTKLTLTAIFSVLILVTPISNAEFGLFANIKKERDVMISRDAMREFLKEHQAKDPDFKFVRDVRGFYGATMAIDVYEQFLSLDRNAQERVIKLLLDSWSISLPKHLNTAVVEMYVENETDPFATKRFLKY